MSNNSNIEKVRKEMIFGAGQIALKMRLPKSMGQLYAALYLSNNSLSLGELAKMCNMSKGNVSINIRHLERWDAVRKTEGSDGRKDYYVANEDLIGFCISRAKELFFDILGRGGNMTKAAVENLETLETHNDGDNKAVGDCINKISELDKKFKHLEKITRNVEIVEKLIHK